MPVTVTEQNTTVTVTEPDKVVVIERQREIVTINVGQPGPKGDKGDPGTSVEVVQSTPSTTWTIVHNLGYRPAGYTIYDTADTIYEAQATYVDDNTMQFDFSSAIAGRVVLI